MSNLYQLSKYTPKYQDKSKDKKKGSGVSLYIHNSLNATVNNELSQVSENLETLFVTLSGDNPLTIGTLYRPPSGNLAMALDELSNILDNLPKQVILILIYTALTLKTFKIMRMLYLVKAFSLPYQR